MRYLARAWIVVAALLGGCGYFGYESLDVPQGPRDGAIDSTTSSDAGSDAELDAGVDSGDAGSDAEGGMADAGPPPGPTFRDLCLFSMITVILDGTSTDDTTGGRLASSIVSGCASATSPTVRMLNQSTPGLLDPSTHQPLLGAFDLGVLGGDDAVQNAMIYLQMQSTPIISTMTGSNWVITERSSGTVLVSVPTSSLQMNVHDIVVIEVSFDISSESTVVSAYGLWGEGTVAAGLYFQNQIAPTISSDAHGYYVVDWMDSDGMTGATSGDSYTRLFMGP